GWGGKGKVEGTGPSSGPFTFQPPSAGGCDAAIESRAHKIRGRRRPQPPDWRKSLIEVKERPTEGKRMTSKRNDLGHFLSPCRYNLSQRGMFPFSPHVDDALRVGGICDRPARDKTLCSQEP